MRVVLRRIGLAEPDLVALLDHDQFIARPTAAHEIDGENHAAESRPDDSHCRHAKPFAGSALSLKMRSKPMQVPVLESAEIPRLRLRSHRRRDLLPAGNLRGQIGRMSPLA